MFTPPETSIERFLGSGQTAHVYLARHERYGRFALKLPRPEIRQQPAYLRMFENEVQFTLALSHPNVVKAYEGHPTGERAYLALEYCSGGTLDEQLNEAQADLTRVYKQLSEVCLGLEHAHGRGILHRDVKPSNIFLTDTGRLKLGDFGTGAYIGKLNDERAGTAYYMAPEVFQGSMATVQSDIYSLGVVAYELVAGVRPFTGNSFEALMVAHCTSMPKSLLHYRPDMSREVLRVIVTAMAKEPEKRYASVRAFREAFELAARERSSEGRAGRTTNHAPGEREAKKEARGLARWFGRKKP